MPAMLKQRKGVAPPRYFKLTTPQGKSGEKKTEKKKKKKKKKKKTKKPKKKKKNQTKKKPTTERAWEEASLGGALC